jgi:biopolymer transport protein ExbD
VISTTTQWRVRPEDARDQGREISLARLAQGIRDGVWSESDQVLAPGEPQWRLIGEHPNLEEHIPRKKLFKSHEAEEAEMDMTPMIDVTFQLLIFFMIAATYIVQKTLDMPKPEANPDAASTVTLEQLEKNNIMVKVGADKSITVQGLPAALENLEAVLTRAVKEHDGAEMVLDVHDDVDHDTVVKVLDAAGGAQIEKVHFVSRVGAGGAKPPGGS